MTIPKGTKRSRSHPEVDPEKDDRNARADKANKDKFRRDEDACSKLLGVYVDEAEKYDGELLRGWKGDMEGLLIFSSLFSASLTAFTIESYKTLQADPAQMTVSLLEQISQQLAAASNGTSVQFEPPKDFQTAPSSLVCNVFWFLALALALTCSLLATLVQQWARDFAHKTTMRSSPVFRARILMYSYFGMRKFRMHTLVDLIPFLLHLSLILFFAGLIGFLSPVNVALQFLMAAFLAIFVAVYFFFTFVPIICLNAPFRTPLSNVVWGWGNALGRWLQRRHGLKDDEDLSLTEGALEKSYYDDMNQHGQKAMSFTFKSLTDDSQLVPLIEALPDALYGTAGIRHSNLPLIIPYLTSKNNALNLITHITVFTDNPSAWLDEKLGARCLRAYPRAIWSLAYILVHDTLAPRDCEPSFAGDNFDRSSHIAKIWFPRTIINKLLDLQPSGIQFKTPWGHSAASALALARLSQLHSVQARIAVIQNIFRLHRSGLVGGVPSSVVDSLSDAIDIDWNDNISKAIRSLRDSWITATSAYRIPISTPAELDLHEREWVNAQVHILGDFLAHSVGQKHPYMLSETYNCLASRIAYAISFQEIQLMAFDDDLAPALGIPMMRLAALEHRDSLSDTIFTYALNHFHWDKKWASSTDLPAVHYRKIIQVQFLKLLSPDNICDADAQTRHLETCLLADLGSWRGDPNRYLAALWLFFHCLATGQDNPRFDLFCGQLLQAFRKGGEACRVPTERQPTLPPPAPPLPPCTNHLDRSIYHLIHALAGGTVCRDIITVVKWEKHQLPSSMFPAEPVDLLQNVKALGKELLPERTEFEDFTISLPEEATNGEKEVQVEIYVQYVKSIHLSLIAKYIQWCTKDHIEEVIPFRLTAFRILYSNFFRWIQPGPPLDERSQMNFATTLSDLLGSESLDGDSEESREVDKHEIFRVILEESFGNYRWLTSRDAARILSEAIANYQGNALMGQRKDELGEHCRQLSQQAEDVSGSKEKENTTTLDEQTWL
ncbi:hypothetical protein D9758_003366 [Tetrapyrgos nigripes]|uniref:DUF6535 domain-containing protein n=1 Tax=Tetrapyrgos nigripes TaxID=182062 RepID=A0A8H5GVI9_9AGAR|nr:hypothetical protein D9758_003366 [Tetrapyrgos nigripes]